MKKLLVMLTLIFGLTTQAIAAESLSVGSILDKFPLKQGIAYSITDSGFNYLSTIEVLDYKGFTYEVGYAGREGTGDKFVNVISYPIVKLQDLGVNVPILELVELNMGLWAGYGNINLSDAFEDSGNNEFEWGVSATMLQVKF